MKETDAKPALDGSLRGMEPTASWLARAARRIGRAVLRAAGMRVRSLRPLLEDSDQNRLDDIVQIQLFGKRVDGFFHPGLVHLYEFMKRVIVAVVMPFEEWRAEIRRRSVRRRGKGR